MGFWSRFRGARRGDVKSNRFVWKRVGGLAAVVHVGREGRVISVDVHRPWDGGDHCKYLGRPCSVGTSPISDEYEERELTDAEIDEALRRALRIALEQRREDDREERG